ncbi:hypothetical protein DVA86_29205 [Streptomyces armeniacus]|uniref:Uncharacterized protein n=1 Tax=Streptomyces armeniacus TaxID=83291 RepID=A0A345Y1I2_9ACTN|nr:hypothetical protein DVA86_29205 [Streptomyces armeniacus]
MVVLVLAGTACSDGDGSDGKDDAAASDTGKTDEDKAVAYRKCLRDNGMDISEPKPGKKKEAVTVDGGNKATMEKAFKACKDKAPNGGPGGEPSQADKDKAIKFAKCMRENGWNMPDPKFEEGAARAMPAPKTAAEKKKFEKANKACGGEFR